MSVCSSDVLKMARRRIENQSGKFQIHISFFIFIVCGGAVQ